MPPGWDVKPPKKDADYFDRLSKAIFTAGLNWKMVENKWPHFREAFLEFRPSDVAKISEKEVKGLMKNTGIVRNEKKIRATINNAKEMVQLAGKFGSMSSYIESFGKKEKDLLGDLEARFEHVGPSTARMFLWSVGYPLTPTKEEEMWMKGHHDRHGQA